MKKKGKKTGHKITVADYIKAVKKADRENELANFAGWRRKTNIHKNKKAYNRKLDKNINTGE